MQLSTLHAAKGLEFDVVFLVGMEDGLLPLRREGNGEADEEEERRLAYVGMTRARRRLFLTLARVRRVNGQLLSGRPSPFLLEVPREVVEERAAARSAATRSAAPARRTRTHGWLGLGPAQGRCPGQEVHSDRRDHGPRSTRHAQHPDGWRPGLKVRHADASVRG